MISTATSAKRGACVLGAIAVGMLLTGCGGQSSSSALSSPTTRPTSSSASPNHDQPTKTSKPAKVKASDFPLAPSSYTPVVRDGVTPHPSISAKPEPFDKNVVYPDGVRLIVSGIHQGRVSGQGPGVVDGPKTTFDLKFVNGSSRSISLESVVPTVTFGSPPRTARPVYDDHTQDFAAIAKPGHSETASYAFSIPTSALSDVTVHLDFDGKHYAATFHGSATQ